MTSDHDPTGEPTGDTPLDPRWIEAMRRHGGTPSDDATWRSIVDRAEDPDHRPSSGDRPRRTATRLGWAAAAAVVALVVGAAAVIATGDDDDGEQVQAGPTAETWDQPAAEWEPLPDPPLSPRDGVMSAWTGEELLVFGGTTWTCPPGADCMGPEADQLLTDGAALDPTTGEWRTIAPIPSAGLGGSVATVGDDVFVLRSGPIDETTGEQHHVLHSYSVAEDEWTEVTFPAPILSGWYTATAAGDRLALVPGSDETGEWPTFFLEPETGEWFEVAPSPLPRLFDRAAVWSAPYLYVFGKEIVPNPGSEEPSLTIGARVDLDSGEWERLPDSEILGTPSVASDGLLVSPQPGGADGGEVNGWGRTYPYGGIFDTATQSWRDLPPAPGGEDAGMAGGVIGSTTASFGGSGGALFDTTTERWIEMPALDEAPGATSRESWAGEVHTAGMDAVVVGGVDWSGDEAGLLGDAWIWRSGRSAREDGREPSDSTTTAPGPSGDETRYVASATVLDDGGGPELCLGGVADSLPPQCGGLPIEGWDWDAVEGEESAGGTTWGGYTVIGTYDGTTFTLTEEPRPVGADLSDLPELLDPPPELEHDLTAPCPEPEGGWPEPDPEEWGSDELDAFISEARSMPRFAGLWFDNRGTVMDDATRGIYVVALGPGQGGSDTSEQALAALWGGPLCIIDVERTYRELEEARDRAQALVEEAGETLLTASIDEVGNVVHLQVVAPAPELQADLDEELGTGTVVLSSALRRLA